MSTRLFCFALAAPLWAACQQIQGPKILAKDLAVQIQTFSTLKGDTEVTFGPLAGVRRVLPAEEVIRLGRRLGLAEDGLRASACFELAAEPLAAAELLPVLQAVLVGKKIDILEIATTPVPHGQLLFTRSGLEPTGLWRGRVLYGSARSVSTWAKVRVVEERTWVEASELLPVGKLIREDQLTLRSGEWSLLSPVPAPSVASAAGKKALRNIAPGSILYPSLLTEPPQVERGDKVSVEVSQGGALLQFEASAETAGHAGDVVFVRNPENGRRFQARVEGKGKVAIRK